ncbi:hypothetical protein [Caballeronia terrestris]|uniref:hypothetical protein n=1 Tax=Caballeronia terrestris TaxID=1226301 RepID=UPI000A59E89D|nr:hypothetical protein [Caballeronia terrestris]
MNVDSTGMGETHDATITGHSVFAGPAFDDEPIRLTVTGDLDEQDEPLAHAIVSVRFS